MNYAQQEVGYTRGTRRRSMRHDAAEQVGASAHFNMDNANAHAMNNVQYQQQRQQQQYQQQPGYRRLDTYGEMRPTYAPFSSPPQRDPNQYSYQLPLQQAHSNGAPPLQLSVQDINPLPESTWTYTTYLGIWVFLWVLYLLTPRGFRRQYCGAGRRRYACRTDEDMPAGGYWLPASKVGPESVISASDARGLATGQHRGNPMRLGTHLEGRATAINGMSSNESNGWSNSWDGNQSFSDQMISIGRSMTGDSTSYITPDSAPAQKTPPSPEHPAIQRIPPTKILTETMNRLQGRGIRLMAHGVQCEPKRVWIRLDQETDAVTWQTEFPRRVPNQSGEISIVLMRGSLHRISLKQVLYIDVGKKTNALMRPENQGVPEQTCLSLLTQNGSLDLQGNSKLERDALVSCFSMILDQVHTEDWRALYESTPEPSIASSTRVSGMAKPYGSDMASV